MSFSVGGFEVEGAALVLGAITGLTYGLFAVGLVLVYRSSRVVNFAHAEIGAVGSSVLAVAVVSWHFPYWVAFPAAMLVSSVVGGLAEVAVIRRLRRAPSMMTVVATLGLGQFLSAIALVVGSTTQSSVAFPLPPWLPQFRVGPLLVTRPYSGMLFLTPLMVLGLTIFLRRSRFGRNIRASAANPDGARMVGVYASRMSTLSWAIAGAVAAFTAILILPTRGYGQSLGAGLLMRALVPAVIARMESLPVALVAGIGVGTIESVLFWNNPQRGPVEGVLFATVLIALALQRQRRWRGEDKGTWVLVRPWPSLPDELRTLWSVRNLGRLVAGVLLGGAIVVGILTSNSAAVTLTIMVAFSLVGLSLGIVMGLAGNLSLGQFALAGVGAVASVHIAQRTGNYILGFGVAGLSAAAASVLIGLPALRMRGLQLAVTTLGFALAADLWLFPQSWMIGTGKSLDPPRVPGYLLDTGKKYYFFALLVLAFGIWLARNVWTSGLGRRLRAVRDNEDAARAFTVSATSVKLQGFAVAGFLAGIGGAVYGHALSPLPPEAFPTDASISAAAMTVLGGLGLLAGPLLGVAYIIGIPRFIPLDAAGLAGSSLGWLLLIMYFPGGIAQLVRPLRDRLIKIAAAAGGRAPQAIPDVGAAEDAPVNFAAAMSARESIGASTSAVIEQDPLLAAQGLTKHFGGIQAVNNISFTVASGETLGLIGPNGAGKTTLFEMLGGFTRPDDGDVIFSGRSVTALPPEARARLGLIRGFQDSLLFPTLTVLETLIVSLERSSPTRFASAVVGWQTRERRNETRALELIDAMGLGPYRSKQVAELSTGTRRITELACLVALRPTVLLLDEPSSGVAQRETEALGDLLRRVKEFLGCTLVVIEHDMPLIMGMSDRIIAMESGRIIAEGSPDAVRRDERVIESYLGGDALAIRRSGELSAMPKGRCQAKTRAGVSCSRRAVKNGLCAQHLEIRG